MNKFIEYNKYYKFLNSLAKDLTKFYYSKLDKKFTVKNKEKGDKFDPVTTSDKAFEKFIRLKITKKFPSHQIIGEEFGLKKSNSDFSWIIDPIDGTRSYIYGKPEYTISLALIDGQVPILGFIYNPNTEEFFFFKKK